MLRKEEDPGRERAAKKKLWVDDKDGHRILKVSAKTRHGATYLYSQLLELRPERRLEPLSLGSALATYQGAFSENIK